MTGLYPPGTACAGGGGWNPALLGSALAAWWSADDHGTALMTDDGSGVISSWTDRIAGIAVTGATTARPTWSAAGPNGKAIVNFDGTANCLVSTSFAALPTGATAGEIWASVNQAKAVGDAANLFAVGYGGAAASTDRKLGRRDNSGVNRAVCNDTAQNLADLQTDLTGVHIIAGTWAGTAMSGRVDGRDFQPNLSNISTLNTGTSRLRIGASPAASAASFWTGGIRHVLVVTTLSTSVRQLLEGWLAWDAGLPNLLPNGHPYRTRRP